MKKYYVGIDPSLSGTGIVVLNTSGEIHSKLLITDKLVKERVNKQQYTPTERLMAICEIVLIFLEKLESSKENILINIEGFSYNSRGRALFEIAGLGYLLRYFLIQKFNFIETQPTQLKKFITGKGGCKKELMLMYTYKKFGVEFTDNNLCDAFGLAQYAKEFDNDKK